LTARSKLLSPILSAILRRQKSHRLLLNSLLISFVFIAGCATTSNKNGGTATEGIGSSQGFSSSLFVDKNGKSYKLKSEIYILDNRMVRLDVTTTLDLPLASVLLGENKIEYVLYRDKKYFVGRPNPNALDPVFPLSIDAPTLISILREEKIKNAQCDETGDVVSECRGAVGGTQYVVKWEKRASSGPMAGRAMKISLELPGRHVGLKFYFTGWQKSVSNAERLMVLQVPPGFQSFSVPEPRKQD
jgi:hypothetical protein